MVHESTNIKSNTVTPQNLTVTKISTAHCHLYTGPYAEPDEFSSYVYSLFTSDPI